jgi:hypothetical protein
MVWLPGFIGPYPSTSLDKSLVVIQLFRLAPLYNGSGNTVKRHWWVFPAAAHLAGRSGRANTGHSTGSAGYTAMVQGIPRAQV